MVKLPDNIGDYGFEVEKIAADVDKSVKINLDILVEQTEKLKDCYERFAISDDDRLRDFLLEAMSSYLNHIAQAFRDIMIYILINQQKDGVYEESLGFCVRKYFTLDMCRTRDAELAAEFLKRRNDLIHDYFNISKENYELSKFMTSHGNGFYELAKGLRNYCMEHFPLMKMEQNIKKAIRKKPLHF